MKAALITAFIGHIICGITDCMMAYTPDGRFDMNKDSKDPVKMRQLFGRMPLKQIELSMLIGVFALFLSGFGFIGLSRWAESYSGTAGIIMYISGLFFIVPISAHHVLCGAVEWFYIKLGRTDEALENVLCFSEKQRLPRLLMSVCWFLRQRFLYFWYREKRICRGGPAYSTLCRFFLYFHPLSCLQRETSQMRQCFWGCSL